MHGSFLANDLDPGIKSNEYLIYFEMADKLELIREIRGFFFEKIRKMMSGQRYFDS